MLPSDGAALPRRRSQTGVRASCLRLAKCRKSPSDQRTMVNSGPMPLKVRRTAAGDYWSSACDARSTALRLYRPYLSEKELQPVKFAAEPLLQADRRGRPSPVLSASSFWRRSRRTGSYSVMPWANRSPFMRLTFLTRPAVRDRRSRLICRQSSCSAVGAFARRRPAARPAYEPARL